MAMEIEDRLRLGKLMVKSPRRHRAQEKVVVDELHKGNEGAPRNSKPAPKSKRALGSAAILSARRRILAAPRPDAVTTPRVARTNEARRCASPRNHSTRTDLSLSSPVPPSAGSMRN